MHLKNLVYLVHVDSTNSPPPLFMNPPSPLSGPHGLRMTPKTVIYNSSLKYQTKLNRMIQN